MKNLYLACTSLLLSAMTVAPAAVCAEEEAPRLADHVSIAVPSAYDCDRNSASTELGYGMMIVMLNSDTDKISINNTCTAPITMAFEGTVFKSIYCAQPDDDQDFEPSINIQSVGSLDDTDDDDGLLDFGTPKTTIGFLFTRKESEFKDYRRSGLYTMSIPDGAFLNEDGIGLAGMTLNFNYTDEANADFRYTLTPDPADVLLKATDLKAVTLAFPDAAFVSYENKPSLKDPNGATIYANYPSIDHAAKCINMTFGNKNTDWDAMIDGVYTLTLAKENYYVDNQNVPNWPAETITVLYNVDRNYTTAVTLVGADAAESYNVYTLDGQAKKLNAAPAELFDLEAGLYIINGKKVLIKK